MKELGNTAPSLGDLHRPVQRIIRIGALAIVLQVAVSVILGVSHDASSDVLDFCVLVKFIRRIVDFAAIPFRVTIANQVVVVGAGLGGGKSSGPMSASMAICRLGIESGGTVVVGANRAGSKRG
ncbi:hypothetical protein KFU94_53420 [Chloroflexi bacterium TSY]|nr:hypothetical protein [Chloroflexi bacterium TSY]